VLNDPPDRALLPKQLRYIQLVALPDFPSLKSEISSLLLQVMKSYRDGQLGPFAKSPRMYYREGDEADYATVQGDVKDIDFKDMTMQHDLTLSDLPRMTHEEILGVISSLGSDFGAKVAAAFYEHLGATLEEAGQTINNEGRSITADFILRMLDSIEIGFDDDGNPNPLDMVGGSTELRARIAEIQNEDEAFRQAAQQLMERKREQWIARESNRKLVD
jgi:hypothetical protein